MNTEHGVYEGSGWIAAQLKYWKPNQHMSDLGIRVADLMGELFYGIYHLDPESLSKVDWANNHHIEFLLSWKDLATTDYEELTRLVFLAHHLSLRVSIEGARNKIIRLIFHPRSRDGHVWKRHPYLEEAVKQFKDNVSIREWDEDLTTVGDV
jgi:hypothetical protein